MVDIALGFEIPTGQPVSIPLHHAIFTGLTQMAGKTTTIEGLLSRAPKDYFSLVFRTKRGEIAFESANKVQPFYRPEVNWEYVKSLLEAAMQQKMKFETSWIIKASKGAKTLADVYAFIKKALERGDKLRGLDDSVWTNLAAYFEKILPELEATPFAKSLVLKSGLNVMDLGNLTEAVQSLVIASCIGEVHKTRHNTITVIPEAWKFLPQGRGSPVKWAAQHLIRESAVLGDYLWIDSQDVTGVDATIRKSVDVWLLGRQRELNEVKRALDQLPVSSKPKPHEVMQLAKGEFYVAAGNFMKKVYVWPKWLGRLDAQAVAMGKQPVTVAVVGAKTSPGETTMGVHNLQVFHEGVEPVVSVREKELEQALKQAGDLLTESEKVRGKQFERLQELKVELEGAQQEAARESKLASTAVLLGEVLATLLKDTGLQVTGTASVDYPKLLNMLRVDLEKPAVYLEPVDYLRTKFASEAIERLVKRAADLSETQKRMISWLIALGKKARTADILKGLGLPDSGSGYTKAADELKALPKTGLVKLEGVWFASNLRQLLIDELGAYEPAPEAVSAALQRLVQQLFLGEEANGGKERSGV